MLSLQGRFQLVTGTTALTMDGKTYEPVPAALAVFAKATWFTATSGSLRPFLSGGLGGGQIRHVVTISGLPGCPGTRSASTPSSRGRCSPRSAAGFSTSWARVSG